MSNLDSYLTNAKFYNPEHEEASKKLSEQALTLAATTVAVGTLLIASKGRLAPELVETGETAFSGALRSSRALTREYFGLGAETLSTRATTGFVAKDVLAGSRTMFLDSSAGGALSGKAAANEVGRMTETAIGDEGKTLLGKMLRKDGTGIAETTIQKDGAATAETALQKDGTAVAENAAKAEATKPSRFMELGARPDPQYGSGTRAIEEKYLGFINGWPVEGVKMHPGGVDIYVTNNHHWLRLKDFKLPTERMYDISKRTMLDQDVQAMDILNTRVTSVRVTEPIAGSTAKPTTTVFLRMGDKEPVKLTGQIDAKEWWHW